MSHFRPLFYLIIKAGSPELTSQRWFSNYDLARVEAHSQGSVVTNIGWLKRKGLDITSKVLRRRKTPKGQLLPVGHRVTYRGETLEQGDPT